MKSIQFIALALVVFATTSVSAQKFGHVDIQGLVYSLPEMRGVDSVLNKYAADSVGGEYTRLSEDRREKDSLMKLPSQAKSVKDVLQRDIAEIDQVLMNWNEIGQRAIQAKQQQLMAPHVKKVQDAVDAYIKENGYTFVFDSQAVVKAPDADNISIPVAKKLGIKVNENPQGAAPVGAPR